MIKLLRLKTEERAEGGGRMFYEQYSQCPHLNGSVNGAICSAIDMFVKNIEGTDIRFCLSRQRHFEGCHVYHALLHILDNAAMSATVAGECVK